MKKIFFKMLLLILPGLFLVACNNGNNTGEPAETPQPVEITSIKKEKKEGNCESEDRVDDCVEVSLSTPEVKKGSKELKEAVAKWADDFVIGILGPAAADPDQSPPSETVDAAIDEFIKMHYAVKAEIPDMPAIHIVEVTDTVLFNDGKYLTLRLDAYMDMGGAHPGGTSGIATFNAETGKVMALEAMIKDLDKLRAMAEKKFREVKAEVFQNGFDFSPDWPFKLADNTGMTKDGILFCYVPYEVGSYAMGYTEFVLTYDELKDLMIR